MRPDETELWVVDAMEVEAVKEANREGRLKCRIVESSGRTSTVETSGKAGQFVLLRVIAPSARRA